MTQFDGKEIDCCMPVSGYSLKGRVMSNDSEFSMAVLRGYFVGVNGAFDVVSIHNHILNETSYVPICEFDWIETEDKE